MPKNALALVFAAVAALGADSPARRTVAYDDLTPAVRAWMQRAHPEAAKDAAAFDAYLRQLQRRNSERRADGDGEHLVYAALQSTRFTDAPPIEPALSARAFVANLTAPERQQLLQNGDYAPPADRLPADAAKRLRAYAANGGPTSFEALYSHYVRAMRFLYQKEFPRESEAPHIAALYQSRGFSTDTAFEANYPIHVALGTIKALSPGASIANVLIVGPGLDRAPRTAFADLFPPQSYQPFAVADSLLSLALADRAALTIRAVDINDAVLRYFDAVRERKVTELHVLASVSDTPDRALSDDYRSYFRRFGAHIGDATMRPSPAGYENRAHKSIRLDEATARRLTGDRLDIVSERYVGAAAFDLIIVTNVFAYFDDTELALALSNIAAMLGPGGHLVHNETRDLVTSLAGAAGLPAIHARSALIARGLYDVISIHRKEGPDGAGRDE